MAVEVSGGGLLPTVQQFCSVVGSYHCAEDLWRGVLPTVNCWRNISLKCMLYVCLECSAQDVSFSWRAGKAFKGESCAAECLFYSPFAAVCYKYGAGGASGGNGAENSFVPELRLGGRRECVIKYYGRRGCYFRIPSGCSGNFPSGNCRIPFHSARFPVVFCPQGRNVCSALVQDKIIFPTVWL